MLHSLCFARPPPIITIVLFSLQGTHYTACFDFTSWCCGVCIARYLLAACSNEVADNFISNVSLLFITSCLFVPCCLLLVCLLLLLSLLLFSGVCCHCCLLQLLLVSPSHCHAVTPSLYHCCCSVWLLLVGCCCWLCSLPVLFATTVVYYSCCWLRRHTVAPSHRHSITAVVQYGCCLLAVVVGFVLCQCCLLPLLCLTAVVPCASLLLWLHRSDKTRRCAHQLVVFLQVCCLHIVMSYVIMSCCSLH